ncbi:hypothetical protein PILCRDRAFT_813817 [Piloderma croceum F 1598]|uniref:Thioredoxin domain-containing protein n=1 Tax=Piloderma croceum (strain F 1598) TaxID=765440 RepID=A0A0C3GAS3_PILCF|nr:hypothetical protein PILCRDRAFT_813817 [Piloderma croceum F 1598]
MPLRISDTEQLSSLKDVSEEYLIFYSSVTESGELWCPDCRDVDPTVIEIFGPSDGPEALIIYVGQKTEWKRPANNRFRGEPWWIESIPTVIKVRDSEEVGRLVDSQVKDHLASFVSEG